VTELANPDAAEMCCLPTTWWVADIFFKMSMLLEHILVGFNLALEMLLELFTSWWALIWWSGILFPRSQGNGDVSELVFWIYKSMLV